jgi:hypothetical protein
VTGAILRSLRLLGVTVTLARVSYSPPDGSSRPCIADGTRHWTIPPRGTRQLRVWLDAKSQAFDGWSPCGRRRVRVALDEWNALQLPVRFEEARSARESEIVADVIRRTSYQLPGADIALARRHYRLPRSLTRIPGRRDQVHGLRREGQRGPGLLDHAKKLQEDFLPDRLVFAVVLGLELRGDLDVE